MGLAKLLIFLVCFQVGAFLAGFFGAWTWAFFHAGWKVCKLLIG